MKFYALITLIAVLVVLLIVDIASPTYGFFARVDSGNVGIVTHFGKIEDRVLPAGFHLTSYFEHVHPVNIRTRNVDGELVAFSADIQQVTLKVSINYNIDPDMAHSLYKSVGENYADVIMAPRIKENVKVVVSNYTAEKLVANRENLSGEVLELLQKDMSKYGISVTAVSIENIDFTDAFEAAVEAKQVATQEKQKAQTEQEQRTMEAKQAAERERITAEAEADKLKVSADAEAYSIRVKAEAEATANEKIASSVTQDLIDYLQAQNWDGKLPGTYVGSSDAMPIIQTESVNNTYSEKE